MPACLQRVLCIIFILLELFFAHHLQQHRTACRAVCKILPHNSYWNMSDCSCCFPLGMWESQPAPSPFKAPLLLAFLRKKLVLQRKEMKAFPALCSLLPLCLS